MISTTSKTPQTQLYWVHQLDRHANIKPDACALKFGGGGRTWRDLRRRVVGLAAVLAEAGVEAGSRVGIVQTNHPHFVEALLASHYLGVIAVPINPRLSDAEIAFILADCTAGLVLSDAESHDKVGAAVSGVQHAIEHQNITTVSDFVDARSEAESSWSPVRVARDSPALIVYTSGTTGKPKGAVLSYDNMIAQTFSYMQVFSACRSDEVHLISTPLFHIAALGALLPCLVLGSTVVIQPTGGFSPESFLDVAEAERVTVAFLVPSQWNEVCDSPSIVERDLELRTIAWAAAPASRSLLRRMLDAFPGVDVVSTFGQTEMSPNTTVLRAEDAERKIGSVGKPLPLVDVRVVDRDMNDVEQGEVGEIVYRGPNTMLGYWNKDLETAEAFAGGWFHSGDLVRVDDEGYIYVVDRLKDMIISGGENIYCAEVESVIAEDPKVAEAALIGRPHDRWGETPVAVVAAATPADPPDPAEIVALCRRRLATFKCPSEVIVVDTLPRNATGKVLKEVLRDKYAFSNLQDR